jgi:hypothetical protein
VLKEKRCGDTRGQGKPPPPSGLPLQRRDGINSGKDIGTWIELSERMPISASSLFSPGRGIRCGALEITIIDRRSKGIRNQKTLDMYSSLCYPGLMWDGTFSVRAASLVSTDPPYELHSRDGSRPLRLLDRVTRTNL